MKPEFLDSMQDILGDEFPEFIEAMDIPPMASIRVNTLKTDPKSLQSLLVPAASLQSVPWCPTGFYLPPDGLRPGKSPLYHAGLYYIQEASAMAAAQSLGVREGDTVLDLCAAPGGKATHLAAILNGSGLLVCNDASPSRAKALVKNLELAGVRNAVVLCEQPRKLASSLQGFFDKILIDAPCSGEGMFRKDKDVLKAWTPSRPREFAHIQAEILNQAAKMLKPGGCILYSTCTFNRLENEDTIAAFLEEHPEFALTNIETGGLSKGLPPMERTRRIWPHRHRGEGHFLALLRRYKDAGDSRAQAAGTSLGIGRPPSPEELRIFHAFLDKVLYPKATGALGRLAVLGDVLHALPGTALPTLQGLRTLKTGVRLGELRKGRFEPGQAFASSLHLQDVHRHIELPPDSPEVLRYLHGETLPTTAKNGYALITTAGHGLGWAKAIDGTLRNKYNKHWVMR